MPPLLACVAYLLSAEVTREVAPEVMAGPHPLVRGALVGDHALVYGLIAPAVPRPGGGFGRPQPPRLELARHGPWGAAAVLRAGLAGGPQELFDLGGGGGLVGWPTRPGPAPLRWQAAGGVLYLASYKPEFGLPLTPPPGSPLEGPGGRVCGVPLTAPVLAACRVGPGAEDRDRLNARGAALREAGASFWLVTLGPVDARFGRMGPFTTDRRPEPELWRTHYDFHLVGPPDRFELYVSAPGGLERRHVDAGPPDAVRKWRLASAHPPAWVGPFYLVADGPDRHFVTGGGVFTLPAGAPPGSALVKTWDGDPVLALVHDSDAGKSYAFTRTHYFHLTSKPDPKPHDLKAFPGATGEEALDTVAKCGRVIRGVKN